MLASVESESVVTTFYNMAGMKSIFFRAICFFAFEASPPPQKSISMIHFVPLFFGGVALHMITCPPPPMVEAEKDEARRGYMVGVGALDDPLHRSEGDLRHSSDIAICRF